MSSTERAYDPINGPPAAAGEPSPSLPSPPQHLPSDLLLEIVARSDATTVIRCTATSKPLRSAILDPAFRRRYLALRCSASGGGFDPGLLLGVSYQPEQCGGIVAVTSPRVRLDAATLTADSDWLPEASRDGLLLLRRHVREKRLINGRVYLTSPLVLRVCDTSTGCVAASLPQATALKYYTGHVVRAKDYATALLPDRERGGGFEVVAMDMHLQVQTFSSQSGDWGAARAVHPAPARPWVFGQRDAPCGAAVVGRTVHWLCFRRAELAAAAAARSLGDMVILAVHADTARAAEMELPRGCRLSGTGGGGGGVDPYGYEKHRALLLHAAGGGTRLGMVAAEADAVTVWTLDSAGSGDGEGARWSRRAVIGRQAIAGQLGTAGWDVLMKLEGIGERSGTVLLSTRRFGGLARLSLLTGEVVEIRRGWAASGRRQWSPCVHETNLGSLLQRMKRF